MKKKFALLLICFVTLGIGLRAQFVNIPDPSFRRQLKAAYPTCFNAAEQMDTTCTRIVTDTVLSLPGDTIKSLEGVQFFKNLRQLNVAYSTVSFIPKIPDLLWYLDLSYNPITTLPPFPNTLRRLYCYQCLLTALPNLPNGMEDIRVPYNLLTSIPPLPNSLNFIMLMGNSISSIPLIPINAEYLFLNNNNLSYLPTIPNKLSNLSISGNTNLLCLPRLPNSLTYLQYDNNIIKCLPNIPPLLSLNPLTKVCNVTNNLNNCQAFPQIFGRVYNDNNKNTKYDSGDVPRINVKVQMSNGDASFTNDSGQYYFSPDTIGSYTITIDTPAFYKAFPIAYSHNFTAYDDIAYDTFALQSNSIADSLSIQITANQYAARPGFLFSYKLNYHNPGTIIQSPVVALRYDSNILAYDSTSISGITQIGDSLYFTSPNLLPGQSKSFVAFFNVKTTAPLGNELTAQAFIRSSNAKGRDTTQNPIRGSYDPNDKQSTPELSPTQVASGSYIDYLVRFQNTGNDSAFTVVLMDTLNSFLQQNVLQIVATSHLCRTTLSKGIIYFEFFNINLPDRGTNSIKSNGFARFRIRPNSNVSVGDMIPNKANIYFDYNLPIVTNTCQTLIKSNLIPLSLLNYTAALKQGKQVIHEWATTNEVNTSNFNVQRSTNGKEFNTIGRVKAKGSGNLNTYQFIDHVDSITNLEISYRKLYYRLEINDRDGSKTYSPIQKVSLDGANFFFIYPNPAKDVVIISGNEMKFINIIDNAGRMIISKKLVNEKLLKIAVKGLSKGIYLLQIITTSGNSKSEKLIIE